MLQHGFNQDDNVWNVNVMFENLTVRKSIIIMYLITIYVVIIIVDYNIISSLVKKTDSFKFC